MRGKRTKLENPPASQRQIELARGFYQNDDVEIDDNAVLSEVPGEGAWVSAWVWVADTDLEVDADLKVGQI